MLVGALLLLIALPIVMVHGSGAPGVADYALAALFVGFVVMETLADQQQWNFQVDLPAAHAALHSQNILRTQR